MPVTPLHLGAGAAFKALGGRHVSFLIFAGSQVLMDIEPLLGIIYAWQVLHGISHTLGGALVIGTVAALIGRPITQFTLQLLKVKHYPVTYKVAFLSAYLGTFSHIALDAIMHADMNPLLPFKQGNPWLGLISVDHLHLLCVFLGVFGAAIISVRMKLWQRDEVRDQ